MPRKLLVIRVNKLIRKTTIYAKIAFNKKPLITRLTDRGSMTLTDSSTTEWIDGKVDKQNIDLHKYRELAKERFDIQT